METAKNNAIKSLEILSLQNDKINNINKLSKTIGNTISYSKYILDAFSNFIKGTFTKNIINIEETKNTHDNNQLDTIISINKSINTILEEQNKTLSEIKQNTINNNTLIKKINSHPLF